MWQRHRPVIGFVPIDLTVAPALFVVGVIIDAQSTVGRLIMHSFPLYLPMLAYAIDELVIGSDTRPTRSATRAIDPVAPTGAETVDPP
jgi:hypothetical protein